MNKTVFLSAHWGHLVLLNYVVDQETLRLYLPPDCEIDLYEGSAYVSLVAFQFTRTKVFGFRWPGFSNFPELNLRFYIKYNGKRGVCFIREYVPSAIIAFVANAIYNEPYKKAWMSDSVIREGNKISANYKLRDGGNSLELMVSAADSPYLPEDKGFEHFFKEHELGVGRSRAGKTVTYTVEHPHWRIYPVSNFEVKMDAGKLYGEPFDFISYQSPKSVVFAEGSEILVFKKD